MIEPPNLSRCLAPSRKRRWGLYRRLRLPFLEGRYYTVFKGSRSGSGNKQVRRGGGGISLLLPSDLFFKKILNSVGKIVGRGQQKGKYGPNVLHGTGKQSSLTVLVSGGLRDGVFQSLFSPQILGFGLGLTAFPTRGAAGADFQPP